MLEVHDLTVRYGDRTAVADFRLRLAQGEIVTLVGPTGCGKSSVLRAIAGLEPLAAGHLVLDGRRIDREHPLPPERRRTGLVFQDFALFPHLTVAQNVGFRVSDPSRAEHWIERLQLGPYRHAMPATLSGGQKQRVALARCLAHEPSLVLLDEPLSNLDAALKANLRWEIRQALKAAGVPALWVTHDQDEALSVGDRVGIMNIGRLEQIGEPEQCYRLPSTRFVASFLGEGVFLRGRLQGDAVVTALGCTGVAGLTPPPDSGIHSGRDSDTTIDVLIRPHDLGLEAAPDGNGRVLWGRYEGETRLYAVAVNGAGELQVRVSHELRLTEGQPVAVRITARHPLPGFATPHSP